MDASVSKEARAAAEGYEALFVPALLGTWTKHLVSAASLQPGQTVLDVGCGTGVLARDAARSVGAAGHVTGLDPASGMLAVASDLEPEITWVSGAAEDLPFDDNQFDTVLSQFAMMFFNDKEQAALEMFRVTKPGGRLVLAVWNTLEANPIYKDIVDLLNEAVSEDAGRATSIPFSLGDPDSALLALETAGLSDIKVATVSDHARFPSPATILEVEMRGWLPVFDIHLSEPQIADVLQKAVPILEKYASSSGEAIFPTSAHIISATNPA